MIDALERCTRAVNRAFALIASVLVLAIVAAILREVVFRYAFNEPSIWALDGARFTLLFVFFLALAPALESGHHVHVDLFDPVIPAPSAPVLHVRRLCPHAVLRRGAVLVRPRHHHRSVRDR